MPVATTDIGHFDDQTVLVVERFDRQWQDAPQRWIARIPQEDFCQVLGLPSEDKYEAQGGPGMAQCLQVLRGSATAGADVRHFLCAQLAFWLLAATDGHAKNFSLFLLPGGRYRMTPLYDVISVSPIFTYSPTRSDLEYISEKPDIACPTTPEAPSESISPQTAIECMNV